jgi:hypothetical protein
LIGFTAVSWAVGFATFSEVLLPVDAEWDCYNTGFTGCGNWSAEAAANRTAENITSSPVEICHAWMKSVSPTSVLACNATYYTIDEAQQCIGVGSHSYAYFILEGLVAIMYNYILGGPLVKYLLAKTSTMFNMFAYLFIILEFVFLWVYSSDFYEKTDCDNYGNARNVRSHIWYTVVSNYFWQVSSSQNRMHALQCLCEHLLHAYLRRRRPPPLSLSLSRSFSLALSLSPSLSLALSLSLSLSPLSSLSLSLSSLSSFSSLSSLFRLSVLAQLLLWGPVMGIIGAYIRTHQSDKKYLKSEKASPQQASNVGNPVAQQAGASSNALAQGSRTNVAI